MSEHKWVRLLAYVTGLVNQQLLLQNEYLIAENRILRAHLPSRFRLTDPQRSTLAEIARRLGGKALAEVAIVAEPETILAWYCRLIGSTSLIPAASRTIPRSADRGSIEWDVLQFRVEEADEQHRGRKIDMVPSPRGVAIWVEGRRHTDFDSLMPIECKRLPTPKGNGRDEREYVISENTSTGGIQRFKAGHNGATHTFGAMIGYVQEETTAAWEKRVAGWIGDLAGTQAGWTSKDLLHAEREDATLRLAIFRSAHERQNGLSDIELRHLWMEMN